MRRGDKVEYAAHPVSWQADGTPGHPPTRDELDLPEDHPSRTGEVPEPDVQDWRPATVIAVFEHPIPIHTPDAKPDTVVKLEPDDGQPPFDLNVKLVRKR